MGERKGWRRGGQVAARGGAAPPLPEPCPCPLDFGMGLPQHWLQCQHLLAQDFNGRQFLRPIR